MLFRQDNYHKFPRLFLWDQQYRLGDRKHNTQDLKDLPIIVHNKIFLGAQEIY